MAKSSVCDGHYQDFTYMNGFCCATSGLIHCCKLIIPNWKTNGGKHHANYNDNCCDTRRCRRNRSRQRGSSRSLGVRLLSSSVLPLSLRLLPTPPTFLRLLPLSSVPSFLASLAPLVLALAGGTNSKAASVVPTASGFAFVPHRCRVGHVGVGYR